MIQLRIEFGVFVASFVLGLGVVNSIGAPNLAMSTGSDLSPHPLTKINATAFGAKVVAVSIEPEGPQEEALFLTRISALGTIEKRARIFSKPIGQIVSAELAQIGVDLWLAWEEKVDPPYRNRITRSKLKEDGTLTDDGHVEVEGFNVRIAGSDRSGIFFREHFTVPVGGTEPQDGWEVKLLRSTGASFQGGGAYWHRNEGVSLATDVLAHLTDYLWLLYHDGASPTVWMAQITPGSGYYPGYELNSGAHAQMGFRDGSYMKTSYFTAGDTTEELTGIAALRLVYFTIDGLTTGGRSGFPSSAWQRLGSVDGAFVAWTESATAPGVDRPHRGEIWLARKMAAANDFEAGALAGVLNGGSFGPIIVGLNDEAAVVIYDHSDSGQPRARALAVNWSQQPYLEFSGQSDGKLSLGVSGLPGAYLIQRRSGEGDWQTLREVTEPGDTVVEDVPGTERYLFYRAVRDEPKGPLISK